MYIVIQCNPDGDTYSIHSSLERAQESYDKSIDYADEESPLYLVEVKEDTDFGFGAQGDFFGGEILKSSQA
jgi:hypothetical protein